jgi:hypothetical protein
MIVKLLMSRLIDLLLIAAAVYFLFPGVRRFFRRPKSVDDFKPPRYTVFPDNKRRESKRSAQGQYIDYEEVK